jgi:hypothetical protein
MLPEQHRRAAIRHSPEEDGWAAFNRTYLQYTTSVVMREGDWTGFQTHLLHKPQSASWTETDLRRSIKGLAFDSLAGIIPALERWESRAARALGGKRCGNAVTAACLQILLQKRTRGSGTPTAAITVQCLASVDTCTSNACIGCHLP